MIKLGLTCISELLKEVDKKNNSFRVMTRKRFNDLAQSNNKEFAIQQLSERIIHNVKLTKKIINYCIDNNIAHYRLSSNLFPLLTDPTLELSYDILPNKDEITEELKSIGEIIKSGKISIGSHPDQFNVLASENPKSVNQTITELNFQSSIFDRMGLPQDLSTPMNLHINCSPKNIHGKVDENYFTKLVAEVADRFYENLMRCNRGVIKRLTVENEDKGYWTVKNILRFHKYIKERHDFNIPACYDNLHDKCNNETANNNLSNNAKSCKETWPDGITPVFHWSEGKSDKPRSHADYVADGNFPFDIDVIQELEVKAKDKAIVRLKEQMAMAGVN
jgi:UV DNA damage endonuclease